MTTEVVERKGSGTPASAEFGLLVMFYIRHAVPIGSARRIACHAYVRGWIAEVRMRRAEAPSVDGAISSI